tara:strand:+ start:137 stop:418 length:282 start_codon:yes stop_codon:yes gene_type:complete
MTRYHATPEGNIPFTAEEELEWDNIETAWNASASDRKAEEIRQERNNIIQQSDWMGSSDFTMSDEWKTYRQALRDIPSQEGFPNSVTWPTKPS